LSERSSEAKHWADRAAAQIVESGRPPVISTGISPSGQIHIGNLREVVTGDAVFRALRERGVEPRFNFVADNFEPLRRVYPFLKPERYGPLVGHPLTRIPAPEGDESCYSEHFLLPFLDALERLRIEPEIVRADQLYESGAMTPLVVRALERRDAIAGILQDLTGKQVAEGWTPFNAVCGSCGRMNATRVVDFSAAEERVDYECDCGKRGSVPMAGGGKLTWRIDWPARWKALGVTVEPFGKDHAARGGSYDTGVRIVREIFGGEPPYPIPYEWIRLKGGGDMASSKGNVLSIGQMLEVVPPEVLRYLVIRARPQRSISFDPGIALLQLVDEVDDASAKGRDQRALQLSQSGGFVPVGVPYKHLVVVAQIAGFDEEKTLSILRRAGYPEVSREAVRRRLPSAKSWLEDFAPEELRFTVQEELPAAAAELSEAQREFLRRLAERLDPSMDGEAIHQLIHEISVAVEGGTPGEFFRAIYLSLLGKPRGPRAGWFLAALGTELCGTRFREAAG
jgi:lysyl-tRNA synthetase class 1